jgi:GT2 family glycosyltransferase
MLVRRSAAGESLFCDDYFMYGEDIGLCRRLRGAGWTMRYVGDARVLHHGGAASSQARSRMRVAGVVSMARLLREAHGPVYAAAYLTSVPFAWLLGMILPKERAV